MSDANVTIESLCAQIDQIGAKAMTLINGLRAERDELRVLLEQRNTQVANLLNAVNAKQARIDALMLEFCPGEMSAEQRAELAKNQI